MDSQETRETEILAYAGNKLEKQMQRKHFMNWHGARNPSAVSGSQSNMLSNLKIPSKGSETEFPYGTVDEWVRRNDHTEYAANYGIHRM